MPYDRNLSPDHPLVVEVARITKKSRASIALRHPMDVYDVWARNHGMWGSSLDIIHGMIDGWPEGVGYIQVHDDHFMDGKRVPGGRWHGTQWLLDNGHSIEDLRRMDVRTAWMKIADGYYKFPKDDAARMWDMSVRVIRDCGLSWLRVEDLTSEKFAEILSQAGFDGTLISKE